MSTSSTTNDDATLTRTYALQGLHCQACVARVQSKLAPLASQVVVSLNPPQVAFTGLRASLAEMQAALAGSSYTIAETSAPKGLAAKLKSWWT